MSAPPGSLARVCHRCGRDIGPATTVGRRDTCLGCGADLHCCLNCDFHEPALHNECREPEAEPQADRAAGNFCDFFRFRRGPRPAAATAGAAAARAQLEALFRKRDRR